MDLIGIQTYALDVLAASLKRELTFFHERAF